MCKPRQQFLTCLWFPSVRRDATRLCQQERQDRDGGAPQGLASFLLLFFKIWSDTSVDSVARREDEAWALVPLFEAISFRFALFVPSPENEALGPFVPIYVDVGFQMKLFQLIIPNCFLSYCFKLRKKTRFMLTFSRFSNLASIES